VRTQSANLSVTHVDVSERAALEAALTPRMAMVWVETPGNPLLSVYDLSVVAAFARTHNLLSVADNTFASPALQRPLEHGIDIVVHSATKYIGGHSDILAGAVVVGDNPDLAERIAFLQNAVGGVLDPFQSFLARRGLMTLELRAQRHAENAMAVAHFLERHPRVERVSYPGLESHPRHDIARRQMSGWSPCSSRRSQSVSRRQCSACSFSAWPKAWVG
jgi:cystathionine gamma-lyase